MSSAPTPRGRHAPPEPVRRAAQRARLLRAGAAVFARAGYAEATAEAIAREAGMSKATFYEHFSNKEECILALFDEAAELVLGRMVGVLGEDYESYRDRVRAGVHGFLATIAEHPEAAQTLLVEIIGAGPEAAERRDQIIDLFTEAIWRDNAEAAPLHGAPVYASRDDAFGVVGAIVELVSRRLRTGGPGAVLALEPVIERLLFGVLSQGTHAKS